MPFDVEWVVIEFDFVVVFEVEDEGVECGVCNEFVVWVVVLFVSSLGVNVEPFGFVKDESFYIFEGDVSEFVV